MTIRYARAYDLMLTAMTFGLEKSFRKTFLDLVSLKTGESVLDVGCGTGTLAIAAKNLVDETGSVSGIDAAPEMVERARKKAERDGAKIDFQTAVAEKLPYPDGHFDVVLNTLIMHHLPADIRGSALEEMRRVLKPSGRMLSVDFQLPRFFQKENAHGGWIRNAIEKAGFNVTESGRTRFMILAYVLSTPGK